MVQISSALNAAHNNFQGLSRVHVEMLAPRSSFDVRTPFDMVRTALRDALATYNPSSYRASLERGATIDMSYRHYKWTSRCPPERGLFSKEYPTPHGTRMRRVRESSNPSRAVLPDLAFSDVRQSSSRVEKLSQHGGKDSTVNEVGGLG